MPIAYYLISKFGKSKIGLSYSLVLTEFILSPVIPSTSARGGGIMYPLVQSLANEYDKIKGRPCSTSAFLVSTSFHANVICCAFFLTAMAGNPIMVELARQQNIIITWADWALGTIVPGTINLLLLPFYYLFFNSF